jgi:thioredoxin-related protein
MKTHLPGGITLLRALAAWAIIAFAPMPSVAGELRLIMFEEAGCMWCARWKAEVGPAYPKTEEGAIAPLTMLNIHEELPDDVQLSHPAVLTPTFVLLSDGEEVGRITGYPGQDFFWGLLGEMLKEAAEGAGNS